jgi:hypothetical protein
LVGGFGRCQYLYTKLRKSALLAGDRIDILQGSGDRPWTAICRGAVLRGLMTNADLPTSVAISSRVSRASYGIITNSHFVEGIDDPAKREWNSRELEYKIEKVKWFLEVVSWPSVGGASRGASVLAHAPQSLCLLDVWTDADSPPAPSLPQGTDITEAKPVKHSFYYLFEQWDTVVSRSTRLEFSMSRTTPTGIDESVKRLCEITWQEPLDLSKFPIWHNKVGVAYRKVDFELEMTIEGAAVEFRVIVGGKQLASQNVDVMYE